MGVTTCWARVSAIAYGTARISRGRDARSVRRCDDRIIGRDGPTGARLHHGGPCRGLTIALTQAGEGTDAILRGPSTADWLAGVIDQEGEDPVVFVTLRSGFGPIYTLYSRVTHGRKTWPATRLRRPASPGSARRVIRLPDGKGFRTRTKSNRRGRKFDVPRGGDQVRSPFHVRSRSLHILRQACSISWACQSFHTQLQQVALLIEACDAGWSLLSRASGNRLAKSSASRHAADTGPGSGEDPRTCCDTA